MFNVDIYSLLFLFSMLSQRSFFRVGDYVNVDAECRTGKPDSEGGKAYISAVEPTVDVQYVISGLLSPDVARERLHVSRISTTGRRRSADGSVTPSILKYCYPKYMRQQRLIAASNTRIGSWKHLELRITVEY